MLKAITIEKKYPFFNTILNNNRKKGGRKPPVSHTVLRQNVYVLLPAYSLQFFRPYRDAHLAEMRFS